MFQYVNDAWLSIIEISIYLQWNQIFTFDIRKNLFGTDDLYTGCQLYIPAVASLCVLSLDHPTNYISRHECPISQMNLEARHCCKKSPCTAAA